MERTIQMLTIGVLLLQYLTAAPSEVTIDITDDIKKQEDHTANNEKSLLEDRVENAGAQGQRKKRFYNHYVFGYPPMNPVIYKRDEGLNTGVYGSEDPFVQIYKKVQEINGLVRQPLQPLPPPPPPQFHSYIPVIYIPFFGCSCKPDTPSTDSGVNPPAPAPEPEPPQKNNQTTDEPGVGSRWPDMEDERQNWGINFNDSEDDDGGDGSRPISFEPIRPNRTMSRPPPPVEHGSVQGDVNADTTTTTTTIRPPQSPGVPLERPSVCDGAILSCCNLPEITYDCFAIQGCPDPSAYGNPCDGQVIRRVIQRFQMYYNERYG